MKMLLARIERVRLSAELTASIAHGPSIGFDNFMIEMVLIVTFASSLC